jgi:metallo-beta-lactamase family protein
MKIHFFGAAGEVTGSCFLLEAGRQRVLVDCGLIQGSPAEERRNAQPFAFDPRRIDAVVLTHAHLDHSGRLPRLAAAGFRGSIYTQRASRDLCKIMLRDAASLAEKDAEHENRKRARRGLDPVEPLYSRAEADAVLRQFRAMDYAKALTILPGVRVTLYDAGHILGSAIAAIELTEGAITKRVVFSGDLGHRGAPILHDPTVVTSADLVVLESTYGDRAHRSWAATWAEMKQVFRDARHAKGNILIPSFAIGRAQELLYLFQQHGREWGIERWQIFLDSPMAIEATEVYARHWKLYDAEAARLVEKNGDAFRLPNLHLTRTPAQSMSINRFQSGAIIIAGSGMCDGGRIRHHLKHNLWREHCHVVFAGFQAQGTLGRQLVDGAREVTLWGERIRVAAQIHTVGGLSAHADQAGLIGWVRHFRGHPPVALVHGEPTARDLLAQQLRRTLKLRVLTPQLKSNLDLLAL